MARLNTATTTTARPAATSAVTSTPDPNARTALGAPGFRRDQRSALYLLGVTLFAGEDAHHETAENRMARFKGLVRAQAVFDGAWTARFLAWLRQDANVRTAAIIGAAEFVRARKDANVSDNAHRRREHGLARRVVGSVLQRADEPGELMAYWTAAYGRKLPQAIRKGIADGVTRMWNERALLKWDSAERAWRFADLLCLIHPKPTAPGQGMVFLHALLRRFASRIDWDAGEPADVPMLRARRLLMIMPAERRRPWLVEAEPQDVTRRLREAGMTWESVAGWLQGPMDAAAWEAVIPAMPYLALLRNLRNFDQAGVSDAVARRVADKLVDVREIAAARVYPFRFLAALRAADSLRWAWPLESALNASMGNIPQLAGNTLVLVDRSPSMWDRTMSEHSTMTWADAAAVFGVAIARRAEAADLVEFGIENRRMPFRRSESTLKIVQRFGTINGTDIPAAVRDHYRDEVHDRVVIITDEQTRPGQLPYWEIRDGRWLGRKQYVGIDELVLPETPVYVWNFGGYEHGAMPTGVTNRHCFGGLTDAGFRLIPMLEAGEDTGWPF